MDDDEVKKIVQLFMSKLAAANYRHYDLVRRLKGKGILRPDELLTVENKQEMADFVAEFSLKTAEELGDFWAHLFHPSSRKAD